MTERPVARRAASNLLHGGRRIALTVVAALLAVRLLIATGLHGGRRSNLLHGGRRSNLLHGGRRIALLHGGRRSNLLRGGRRIALLHGGRRSNLLRGGRRIALLHGGRRSKRLLIATGLHDGRRSDWRAVLGAQIADSVLCRGWPAALVALKGGRRPSLVLAVVSNDRSVRSLQYVTSPRDRWKPATLQVLQ